LVLEAARPGTAVAAAVVGASVVGASIAGAGGRGFQEARADDAEQECPADEQAGIAPGEALGLVEDLAHVAVADGVGELLDLVGGGVGVAGEGVAVALAEGVARLVQRAGDVFERAGGGRFAFGEAVFGLVLHLVLELGSRALHAGRGVVGSGP